MARFKFGKKKRDDDTADERHSYLRRPSVSSRTADDTFASETTSLNESEAAAEAPEPAAPAAALHGDVSPAAACFSDVAAASTPWKRHRLVGSPFPRYRHAAAAVSSDKNELFLMGGLKDGAVFGDTWRITPHVAASGAIEALHAEPLDVASANDPPARVGHASVLCGNAYIVYGGDTVDTDYNGFPDDNVYMFNINNRKYTVPSHLSNKPQGRYGHSMGVVSVGPASSRLYLFGGQLENAVYSDLYSFELTSFKSPKARWELVEPAHGLRPPPLTNHSMCVYKSKIYVFGGVYNNEKVSNDVWCFDTGANRWSQLATSGDVPSPVNEHAACIVGDRLYVYGGNDFSGTIYDSLYCLNLHSLRWTKLAKEHAAHGPGPRCGHSLSYLPKLNKLLVMGGDKNDYIGPGDGDFEVFEELAGEQIGTMVYELDLAIADHFMGPKKLAASAGVAGGAAGVVNRRASPSPSMEDALTRHRRSMSAGVDDFRTPNGSSERLRSLDPKPAGPESVTFDTKPDVTFDTKPDVTFDTQPDVTFDTKPELGEPQLAKSERRADFESKELGPPERFVDVPSSGAQSEMNDSTSVVDVRDKYDDFEYSSFHNGTFRSEDPVEDRPETPVQAHVYEEVRRVVISPGQDKALASPVAKSKAVAANTPRPEDSRLIAELKAELEELKSARASENSTAKKQIHTLEAEAKILRSQHDKELSSKEQGHSKLLTEKEQAHNKLMAEKDTLIQELMSATNPDLEAPANADGEQTRGFTELTRHKLNALHLSNQLVYLRNENEQLREKHARFEPFMNNQISDLAALHKMIERQEARIAELAAQVKSESVLRGEIASWKHKYEDLELEFNTYRALNAEIVVSDDEAETGTRSASQISSKLGDLVSLWQTSAATANASAPENAMVPQLQKQLDDLMQTSQTQHERSAAEVQKLEEELQAKLLSLKTFEENYRDALQSVQNTSRALDLTQDELRTQKLTMEKLVRENNELMIFKKAAQKSPDSSSEPAKDYDAQFNSAHYNMKVKDLEADLYILRQEKDQLNATVSSLKKELYLAKS